MADAASLDLRRRVVAAYRRGGVTYDEVADRFAVSRASVSRWLRREREVGDVEPRPHGGGQPRRIQGDDEKFLRKLVEAHPDWTEAELAEELRAKRHLDVSDATAGRAVRRFGYTVKKKRSLRPSEIVPTCSDDVPNGPSESLASPLRVWFLWTRPARTSR